MADIIQAKGITINTKLLSASAINAINSKYDKTGGEVSGDISIIQHNINILSGNYIQTSTPDTVVNYASKNAFIQTDVDPHYGDSYTSTKAFCVLGLSSSTNQIKLSGDIQVLKDIVDGRLSVGDMPVDIGKSRSMRNVFGKDMFKEGDMVTNGTNMSAAMFSLTLDDRAASMSFHLSAVDVESGIVTLKESLKDADGFDTLDGHTTSFFEDLWLNDDNAFYLVGFPELGNANVPNNFGQFASGGSIRAIGRQTHAEGRDSIADIRYAHVEGSHCTAVHMATHAEGFRTVANKRYSHSEGEVTKADGRGSHAEGYKTMASGDYSHAEGMLTLASGIVAHAEGNQAQASATGAHAEGLKSIASGSYSHTEGNATSAVAEYSHAEGISSYTAGIASHAEGFKTLATGKYAHAEGEQTQAVTDNAHAAGFMSYAGGWNSTAIGRYSKVKDDDHNAFVWQGVHQNAYYESKGLGTFCINPRNGLSGFYIGADNFISCVVKAVQAITTDSTKKAALKTALQTILA